MKNYIVAKLTGINFRADLTHLENGFLTSQKFAWTNVERK